MNHQYTTEAGMKHRVTSWVNPMLGWAGNALRGGGCLLVALLLGTPSAQAFVLGKTRIILTEGDTVSVPVISGKRDGVLLIQARTSKDVDGKVHAPELVVSPPLLRLEKGGRGLIRLTMANPAGLPLNQESVRYLTVSGIPSSNPLSPERGKVQGDLTLGQGAIIKVFYRPRRLGDATETTWHSMSAVRVPGGVQISNPTPYYMSFSLLAVDKHPVVFGTGQSAMLAPFSRQLLGTASVTKKELEWSLVNDMGATVSGQTPIR